MNVTVFGATGGIGQQIVDRLLANGHTVTAYARNRGKVPPTWSDRVRVVIAESTDAVAIDSAVAGADAVVSALGPSMDRKATGLPLVAGTRHIVDAMQVVGMSQAVTTSGLDWRIGRFLAPKDGPARGRVRHGFYGTDRLAFAVTRAVTRADIAAFTAAQVDDARYLGAAPAISN